MHRARCGADRREGGTSCGQSRLYNGGGEVKAPELAALLLVAIFLGMSVAGFRAADVHAKPQSRQDFSALHTTEKSGGYSASGASDYMQKGPPLCAFAPLREKNLRAFAPLRETKIELQPPGVVAVAALDAAAHKPGAIAGGGAPFEVSVALREESGIAECRMQNADWETEAAR
jgi:hypothetical protein